ncbi:MAG: sulfotransferase domain-containing protein [Candidatus Thorarchaeota archaeon]
MVKFFPDDTFLVSYPKSGNTWVRFLICNYLNNDGCDFLKISQMIPELNVEENSLSKCLKPRIFKSHLPHQPDYKNVIYLVRDGRDIAVSYYFHLIKQKKMDRNTQFSEFINKFNRGELQFGSWSAHVISWLKHKTERFLLIKYEEVLNNPQKELEKILHFLGIEINFQKIKTAIETSSFYRMSQLEHEQQSMVPTLADSILDIPFIRKGIAGDYLNYFNKEQEAEFIKIHFEALKRLDYI